jgi:hypothetical protein
MIGDGYDEQLVLSHTGCEATGFHHTFCLRAMTVKSC